MPDRSLSQQPSLCGRRSDRPLESTEEIVCYDLVDAFAAQTSAVVSGLSVYCQGEPPHAVVDHRIRPIGAWLEKATLPGARASPTTPLTQ